MLCTVCNERPVYAKARCQRCLQYYQRKGIERPAKPTWHKGQHAHCTNCGSDKLSGGGRCKACRQYYARTGNERPASLWQRRQEEAKLAKWCRNCGNPQISGYMRCHACRVYWKKHGKERPYRYFQDNPTCKTCKIPLHAVKRKTSGRCEPCYEYRRKFKKERPDKFWGHGPHGWCECGNAAHHMIDSFPLCNECTSEFQQSIESVATDTHIPNRGSTRW